MKKVLIIIPYYFPGFKFGGPQQSVKNIVDAFGEDVVFYIYTQNTDYCSSEQYEGVDTGKWIKTGNSSVMYMLKKKFYGKKLVELYKEFEIIYACGLFEKSTIILLFIHRILRNKCKDIYRQKDMHNLSFEEVFGDDYMDNNNDFIELENNIDIFSLIDYLKDREKQIIILYINGYDNKSISKKLKINENTVRSSLMRIKRKIKTMSERMGCENERKDR